MKLNSQYNFREGNLGPDFAKEKVADFRHLIDRSISFVAMSMPGVGASYFLKYLAMQDFAFFFHIDLYALPSLTQHELYKLLLTELGGKVGSKTDEQLLLESRNILKTLAQKWGKIVIIFSRFDQLKKEFDWNFLSNIQSLSTMVPDKIVLIFTSVKPLNEVASDAVSGGNLNFYSKNLYFKPFSKSDLKKLLSIESVKPSSDIDLDKLIELSGGHNQLLHILLNSHKQQNLLLDQFVTSQLKSLLGYLDYQQTKQVRAVATNPERLKGAVGSIDEYLLGIGMVKKTASGYELFTPLLAEYIKTNLPVKLPVKEAKLFKLLRNNLSKIVSKDEIFASVWPNDDGASDWALDALIYRLRKHPFTKAHGYIIESQKKQGYTLIQT